MRIESLVGYKYFLQSIKEEPLQLKPYSYFLVLIPLLVICFLFDWDRELLLFVLLGYFSAGVGFFTAKSTKKQASLSLNKRAFHQLAMDSIEDIILIRNNRNQKISFANTAFFTTLGIEQDRISDLQFEDFIHPESLHLFKSSSAEKFSVNPISFTKRTIQMYTDSGAECWMELNMETEVENGDFTIFNFKNVTDTVATEKATQQFAMDLVQQKMTLRALKRKANRKSVKILRSKAG